MREAILDAIDGGVEADDEDDLGPPAGGEHAPEAGACEGGVAGLAPAPDIDQQRKDNSKNRAKALHWLCREDPEGMLIVLRKALGPMDTAMKAFLKVAGAK